MRKRLTALRQYRQRVNSGIIGGIPTDALPNPPPSTSRRDSDQQIINPINFHLRAKFNQSKKNNVVGRNLNQNSVPEQLESSTQRTKSPWKGISKQQPKQYEYVYEYEYDDVTLGLPTEHSSAAPGALSTAFRVFLLENLFSPLKIG